MAEISVQFKNKFNGYDKTQVQEYIRVTESKLQETSAALAQSQQQIEALEARVANMTGGDSSVEEKVALYDKLMKKMDGDYANLLAPAIAKAKAIEDKAEAEYAVRMDQARYAAEGIYTETADRIVGVVDGAVSAKMDDVYNLIDAFLYSKTLAGRVKTFMKGCRAFSEKVVAAANNAKQLPGKAAQKIKTGYAEAKVAFQKKLGTYKEETATADAE